MSGITELPVASLIDVDVHYGANSFADSADQIWVWDNTTLNWKRYYYYKFRQTEIGWCNENTSEATSDTVKNGDAFFFRRSSSADGNITLSGALNTSAQKAVTMAADQLYFVCNPWPVEVNVADIKGMLDVNYGANSFADSADQIWLWDDVTHNWKRYYYYKFRQTDLGFCKEEEAEVTTDKIAVGQGFFFRRSSQGAGTLTWTKPAGL